MAQQVAECGYCGALAAVSDEHIPPKSFFEGLKNEQLRTVKSCADCNLGASDDDEYFRDTVVKYYRIADQPKAKPIVDKMIRAAGKSRKRAYALAQLRSFSGVFGSSPNVPTLGPIPAFKVDGARMERAACRYIRGLHRHDFGERIASEAIRFIVTDPERVFAHQTEILDVMRGGAHHEVQQGVFEYMWAVGPNRSKVCLMVFFSEYAILGFIGGPDVSGAT